MKQNKPRTNGVAENRKTRIINEATILFAEKGYHTTTLDEVATKMGVTKAALYYYFRNKEAIIRAIMRKSLDRMNKAISLSKSKLSPKDKLHKFIAYLVEFNADGAELTKILFEQTHALPKRTRDSIKRKKKEVDKALQNILHEGVEDGSFAIDDVKIVSYAILGLCIWTYRWYRPNGRLTPEQISEVFINLLERGYLN